MNPTTTSMIVRLPLDILDVICRDDCLCYLDAAHLACSCLVLSTRMKPRNEEYRVLQRQRTTQQIERIVAIYAATAGQDDSPRMRTTSATPTLNWKIKGVADIVFARTYYGGAYVRLVVRDTVKMRDAVGGSVVYTADDAVRYVGVHDGAHFWTYDFSSFAHGYAHFVRLIRAMATDYARSLPLATLAAALDRVHRRAVSSAGNNRKR